MSCNHMNKDGTFKGGFDGCVLHMTGCEGHSEDSAKRICGKIAQQVKGGRPEDWAAGLVARADAADGDETLYQHISKCPQCKTGILCQKGKTMMLATVQAGTTSTAYGSFAGAETVAIAADAGDQFDIQWMPPGRQEITCFVSDEKADMDFEVRPEHAAVINSALQYLRNLAAAGQGDRPFIDFNHEDGAASGHPTEIYWAGDGARGGIRMKGQWTGSGKSAVVNRDFTRFSPQWGFDPQTQEPTGIGVNLGGLVNRAAFRDIAPVVAKDAGKPRNRKDKKMTREEFQAALAEGLKPVTERITALEAKATSAGGATGATTAQAGASVDDKIVMLVQTAIKPLTEKIGVFETAQAKAAEATAKDAVQKHVARGAIAPEDTETINFYVSAYAKDAAGTEKVMAKLPGKTLRRITTGDGATATATFGMEPQQQFLAKAKQFAKDHSIEGDDVEVVTAFARTPEGKGLYEQFRNTYAGVKRD